MLCISYFYLALSEEMELSFSVGSVGNLWRLWFTNNSYKGVICSKRGPRKTSLLQSIWNRVQTEGISVMGVVRRNSVIYEFMVLIFTFVLIDMSYWGWDIILKSSLFSYWKEYASIAPVSFLKQPPSLLTPEDQEH